MYERKRRSDGCVRCEEDDPACLDYHHREETEKVMTVSEMVTHGYSKDRLRAEIAKCVLLCANCHRKEHYEIPDYVPVADGEVGNDDK